MTEPIRKFTALTPELYDYLVAHNPAPDPALAELRRETSALGDSAAMQISVEQGRLLTLFSQVLGARRAVEVGTFTGYSAISIARGLVAGGRLLCCDVNESYAAIARRAFARAGVADQIDLVVAPAIKTLRALPRAAEIDLAFLDADKAGYRSYYEEILPRLRPGGLVLFDNVLWDGAVLDATDRSESTEALRAINDFLLADNRVDIVMIPVADGLTIARRKN
jgi:caffeoyl-CoA O-methyltransferase